MRNGSSATPVSARLMVDSDVPRPARSAGELIMLTARRCCCALRIDGNLVDVGTKAHA